ncbi:type VII secretion system-associated protein [Streptomyces sp. NPDC087659]|uniref:type VII secretion system-associated protein n=1 Tax=Streptomyces sp. NPDC087659 TaxID=3365801 RepID=UPI003806F5C7
MSSDPLALPEDNEHGRREAHGSSPDGVPDENQASGEVLNEDPLSAAPSDIRTAARIAPDHWIGMVDPAWRGDGTPPNWAIVGEWRSGTTGEIEEWRENDNYRPSPDALGWPAPTDDIDEAVQRASTGYGSAEDVYRLLAKADVRVPIGPDDRILATRTPDGDPAIPVFTSDEYLRSANTPGSRAMPSTELIDEMPTGHCVLINPTAVVSMKLEKEGLQAAIADAQT